MLLVFGCRLYPELAGRGGPGEGGTEAVVDLPPNSSAVTSSFRGDSGNGAELRATGAPLKYASGETPPGGATGTSGCTAMKLVLSGAAGVVTSLEVPSLTIRRDEE